MANIDIYSQRSITNAVLKVKTINPFVVNMLFGKKRFHATETFDRETISSKSKLAQFVNDYEGAKVISKHKRKLDTIKIPRTFEEKNWLARELADLNVHKTDIYLENTSQLDKIANDMVLMEIRELKDRVLNRREQMACSILNTGKFSVAQDNVEFEYDFGFVNDTLANGGHLISNATSASKWNGGTSVNILKNIKEWKRAIAKRSGLSPNICILGENASDAFIADEEVRSLLNNNNYKIGRLDLEKEQVNGGNYIGHFLGIDFYEYSQEYNVDDDTTANLIDVNKAILIASRGDFKIHYAPIYRIDNNEKSKTYNTEFLLEPKVSEDNQSLRWKLEQKSIPVPHDPDTIISATVCA